MVCDVKELGAVVLFHHRRWRLAQAVDLRVDATLFPLGIGRISEESDQIQ